jgi:hypothetical protein
MLAWRQNGNNEIGPIKTVAHFVRPNRTVSEQYAGKQAVNTVLAQ